MFKLDSSFECISSMSPKINKTVKRIKPAKSPYKLSLKKNIRKSGAFDKKPSLDFDNSVVIIEDSFEESSSPTAPKSPFRDLVKKNDVIPNTFLVVDKWLSDNKKVLEHSQLDLEHDKCLDKLGSNKDESRNKTELSNNKKSTENGKGTKTKMNLSLEAAVHDDSFENNIDSYEDILDKLYGLSWREKREEILPQSEKKPARKPNVRKAVAQTEKKPVRKKTFTRLRDNDAFNKKLDFSDSEDEASNSSNISDAHLKSSSSSSEDLTKFLRPTTKTSTTEKFSFLYSLSDCLPSWQSNTDARYFRDNYKVRKEELAKHLFALYNERVFKGALQSDTPIEWNTRVRKTAGMCYNRRVTHRDGRVERCCRIVLAPKVLTSASRLRDTLLHELCHAAAWIVDGALNGHGAAWRAWAERAQLVFPELPPVRRCHDYVIQTKFTYRCEGCGYTIGRHSKSLDVERNRCGHCLGRFELLVNGKTKRTDSGTPRKPAPFAQFVQENYSDVRCPDTPHGATMKILSQRFQQLKLKKHP